jgi:hypothetical protein
MAGVESASDRRKRSGRQADQGHYLSDQSTLFAKVPGVGIVQTNRFPATVIFSGLKGFG